MGAIIDGKAIADMYKEEISDFVREREKQGLRVPCLCAVIVGEDGGSISYINGQKKVCESLGVKHKMVSLPEDISEAEFIKVINQLNVDIEVDGVIIQLPLPKHINEKKIVAALSYLKDVDGLTYENIGRFYKGEQCFVPCTPQSVMTLLKSTGISMEGKHAVVVGRSNIVGRPVAELLLRENATVSICHSKTVNLKEVCRSADILVSAMGKPGFITGDYVKAGAVAIDVGTTRVEGKIKGDFYFEEIINKAAFVTPVPGGVGTVTTTLLIKNTCEALKRNVY
jgi:methylenetetrahydrofolate dehydrogenase (NADP+)/methenyltetrahydrofolate cyclohydrolase